MEKLLFSGSLELGERKGIRRDRKNPKRASAQETPEPWKEGQGPIVSRL